MRQGKPIKKTTYWRRSRLAAALPPLDETIRGSLFERKLRCGKNNCRCARGKEHAVFYLSATFAGGKTEQISLPEKLVPVVRKWVGNYRQVFVRLERISKINREWIRDERARLKGGVRPRK